MENAQVLRKRWTLDILHDQIRLVVHRIEIMHLDNVGMAQLRNDTRLSLETHQRVRTVLAPAAEDLHRDLMSECKMRAYINLCYTSPRHQRFDLDLSQPFPNPIVH